MLVSDTCHTPYIVRQWDSGAQAKSATQVNMQPTMCVLHMQANLWVRPPASRPSSICSGRMQLVDDLTNLAACVERADEGTTD